MIMQLMAVAIFVFMSFFSRTRQHPQFLVDHKVCERSARAPYKRAPGHSCSCCETSELVPCGICNRSARQLRSRAWLVRDSNAAAFRAHKTGNYASADDEHAHSTTAARAAAEPCGGTVCRNGSFVSPRARRRTQPRSCDGCVGVSRSAALRAHSGERASLGCAAERFERHRRSRLELRSAFGVADPRSRRKRPA